MSHALIYAPVDAFDTVTRRRPPMLPPKRLRFVGGGDFEAIGRHFLEILIQEGGLQSGDRVLDVGCGVGRIALPLTKYLDSEGSYEGFDIRPSSIRWCQRAITSRHPRFRFQVVDVSNGTYYPRGLMDAADFTFPFPDEEFDMVFLASVFTHLLPDEMRRYAAETQRVLKPGGRGVITWFLLNDEAHGLLKEAGRSHEFSDQGNGCWARHDWAKESAVAYEEPTARDALEQAGLHLLEPIRFGFWCGRASGMSGQDITLVERPG